MRLFTEFVSLFLGIPIALSCMSTHQFLRKDRMSMDHMGHLNHLTQQTRLLLSLIFLEAWRLIAFCHRTIIELIVFLHLMELKVSMLIPQKKPVIFFVTKTGGAQVRFGGAGDKDEHDDYIPVLITTTSQTDVVQLYYSKPINTGEQRKKT
ncbi:hypothetical protein A9F07_24825 [Klebsiella pneumoniae]|nr:hypothetical protein A9F07_24825 [Klebsiella pneumoniae]